MPQIVELPGNRTVEFPDGMPAQDMQRAIEDAFPDLRPPARATFSPGSHEEQLADLPVNQRKAYEQDLLAAQLDAERAGQERVPTVPERIGRGVREATGAAVDALASAAQVPAVLGTAVVGGKAEEQPLFRLAQSIKENIRRRLEPQDAAEEVLQSDAATGIIPRAAGSSLGALMTGRTSMLRGRQAVAFGGSLVGGGQQAEEARSFGASDRQELIALLTGAGLGTTEAVGFGSTMNRLDKGTGGKASGYILRKMQEKFGRVLPGVPLAVEGIKESFEEGLQEVVQQVGGDVVASSLAGYDPNRSLSFQKAEEAFFDSALGGFFLSGAGSAAKGLIERLPKKPPAPAPPATTPQEQAERQAQTKAIEAIVTTPEAAAVSPVLTDTLNQRLQSLTTAGGPSATTERQEQESVPVEPAGTAPLVQAQGEDRQREAGIDEARPASGVGDSASAETKGGVINAQEKEEESKEGNVPGLILGTSLETWADGVITDSRKRVSIGLDPTVLIAYGIKGAALLEKGIRDIVAWGRAMLKEFPELKQAQLPDIYAEAQRQFAAKAASTEPLREDALTNKLEREQSEDDAEKANAENPVRKGGIITQIFGRRDTVESRLESTPEGKAAGAENARRWFAEAGLNVTPSPDGTYQLADPGVSQEESGQKLITILAREIANQREAYQQGYKGDYLGNLLNSVRNNILSLDEDRRVSGQPTAFSQETYQELYSLAQGEASLRGLMLNALIGAKTTLSYMARHVATQLHAFRSRQLGGEQIRRVLDEVTGEVRDSFTEEEIGGALGEGGVEEVLVKRPRRRRKRRTTAEPAGSDEEEIDLGSELYARVQQLLAPKQAKTVERLEANAQLQEAVRKILQTLAPQGITPKPAQAGLSPLQQLLLMVEPGNSDLINTAIDEAITLAEENAGDEGLSQPQYQHWEALRDTFLGYSPVTVKLAEKLIQEDFQGTKFNGERATRPVDTRIDMDVLAKAPDAEVNRVIGNYMDNLAANMELSGATPETQDRILALIEDKIRQQFAPHRQKYIDSIIHRVGNGWLLPSITSLTKEIFDTPVARHGEIKDKWVTEVMAKLGFDERMREILGDFFDRAFTKRFEAAKAKALKRVRENMSREERKLFYDRSPLWKQLVRAVNAGEFNTDSVLKGIAASKGWPVPTDAEMQKMRDWAAREAALRTLPQSVRDELKDNPAALAERQERLEATTRVERGKLLHKMQTQWAAWTKPIASPFSRRYWSDAEILANTGHAINELIVNNLLSTAGFFFRQTIDVGMQGMLHSPTRALGEVLRRLEADWKAERPINAALVISEIGSALKESYAARSQVAKAQISSLRTSLSDIGGRPNPDRMIESIAAMDRLMLKADKLEAEGKTTEASILRIGTYLISSGRTLSQVYDAMSGTKTEFKEMRHRIVTTMREEGKSKAEIDANTDRVFGIVRDEVVAATAAAVEDFALVGHTPTEAELTEAAWNIYRSRIYRRAHAMNLVPDDFEEEVELLKNTRGWNIREDAGIGGVVANFSRSARNFLGGRGALGAVLSTPFAFGNAIGTSINRAITFLGGGLFPEFFGLDKSAWFKSEADRAERKVEAIIGVSTAATLFALVALGLIKVRRRWPEDEEERNKWISEGRRPGTVEFPVGADGGFIPISTRVGPFAYIRPALDAGSALYDLIEGQKKKQEKLNKEAAERGLTPGTVAPLGVGALMGVPLAALWSSLAGGRTSAGIIGSYTDFGRTLDVNRVVAGVVGPTIPFQPAWSELTRAAGHYTNPKTASLIDSILPVLGSDTARFNMLGDKSATPSDAQRIIQTMTGGTFPGVVNPNRAKESHPYAVLYESGYRPPSFDGAKPYLFGNELRPMTRAELRKYIPTRGKLFAEELQGVSLTGVEETDRRAVQQAFKRAETRALAEVGAAPVPSLAANRSRRSSTVLGVSISPGTAPQRRASLIPRTAIPGTGSGRARGGRGRSLRGRRIGRIRPGRLRASSRRGIGRRRMGRRRDYVRA